MDEVTEQNAPPLGLLDPAPAPLSDRSDAELYAALRQSLRDDAPEGYRPGRDRERFRDWYDAGITRGME
jgi:hypothetical protein